jgi:NRAMP (natural resistance-associated macrophage protein)-like metal ion transporter
MKNKRKAGGKMKETSKAEKVESGMPKESIEKGSKEKEIDNQIEPGMLVEADKGDLGEGDISKPKVTDVVQDHQGNVKDVVVEKGALFRKKLVIPVDRVNSVEQLHENEKAPGKVKVNVGEQELEDLKPVGLEELPQEGPLDKLERKIPTHEGLRELEAERRASTGRRVISDLKKKEEAEQEQQPPQPSGLMRVLRTIGPGFLSGMAGNDATACTAYAIDGATAGFGHLWLMLLSTPMYQAVQYASAKIGRVTHKGVSEILRQHYSRWVALPIACVLIVANIALLAGDLVAVGSGLELITGISWFWFVIPVAAILWYLTVFRNFETIKKIFIVLSLAFLAYIVTAIFSHANWQEVLVRTFVPQIHLDVTSVSAAVALLGATITPYSMIWQAQGEKEQSRPGSFKQQMRSASLDVASGVIGGNLVSYFIIVTTAATLFTHHHSINTAADAAAALQPLVGPFAKYIFAIGLIGAGVVAIPVILASTSYAVAGSFGWSSGLSKKPWQTEGFYLILTVSLLIGIVIALLRIDPIKLIFWANILVGILAPVIVLCLILIGNSRKIMRDQRLGWLTNLFLGVTAVVLVAAAVLFFYGLASGQGG